jgi:DNA (cytosine-5)-methyltransferase 1
MRVENFSVVDLFCGVGGLTHGFVKEGFNVSVGIDVDESCRFAFEANNNGAKFINKDVSKIKGEDLLDFFIPNTYKVLVGCAPCQDFSAYRRKYKEYSGKWKMVGEFARLISELQPDIVSMENVPQLIKHKGNGQEKKIFELFVENLENNGYEVTYKVVDAQDYGVPQRRKRLLLIASKVGRIELLLETHFMKEKVTVREAIGFLPSLESGEVNEDDNLHRARALSSKNIERIKATPHSGGSWKDWKDESLILPCHRKMKEKGKKDTFGSVYGRMSWDNVSPTLTTYCTNYSTGRFGHPEQNRAISLREAALLQSFPKDYKFINKNESFRIADITRHIGNAVPVKLGEVIAQSIKNFIAQK